MDALRSVYIIDGLAKELTPERMLEECLSEKPEHTSAPSESLPIIDETLEPQLGTVSFEAEKLHYYLSRIYGCRRNAFPITFADSYTRNCIARALVDSLWLRGNFRLGDLSLKLSWRWNESPVGNMAAFYESAEAVADYMDSLGVKIDSYGYLPSVQGNQFEVTLGPVRSCGDDEEGDLVGSLPYHTEHPFFGMGRCVDSKLVPDSESWVVFIPMETCDFRLGGSLLCDVFGSCGESGAEIRDGDYFNDCYEVLREFSEDGVILSGATVGDGGLMATLRGMCGECGLDADVADLLKAYPGPDAASVLFGEIPGAVIQVRDIEYDYMDAEMLLQDVVYFPLGHPAPERKDLVVNLAGKTGIQSILESLIRVQTL